MAEQQLYINPKALSQSARLEFEKRNAKAEQFSKTKQRATDRVLAYANKINAVTLSVAERIPFKEYFLVMRKEARDRELELNLHADAINERKQAQPAH